ncbi:uncharacterized protein [Venturia canescens]|uniref:uncharacterized protein n=1 Tax=Venturia canescens TaxID=32260 RepID=UPI001C9BBE2F|nr:uncharacterized protein LOC122406886 [Venturia canescens]
MWQRTFCLLGSFLVLCTLPSKSDVPLDVLKQYIELLDEQELKTAEKKDSRNDEPSGETGGRPADATDPDEFGCWRYCVEKKASEGGARNGESTKRVNIVWNVVDDAEVAIAEKRASSWGIFTDRDNDLRWESSPMASEKLNSFHSTDTKCELFLEIGCASLDQSESSFPTILDEFTNAKENELISKSYVTGSTSTPIRVGEDIEELRILAFGVLLQLVLEVPIAQPANNSTTTRGARPVFSLSRTSDAEGLFVDARNPPPGEWRLGLLGMANLNYSFTVTSAASEKLAGLSNEKHPPIAMPMSKISGEDEAGQSDMELSENLMRPQRMAYPKVTDDNDSVETIKLVERQEMRSRMRPRNDSRTANSSFPGVLARKLITKTDRGLAAELELSDYSRGIDEVQQFKKRLVVDVHPDAKLIVSPGVVHDVVFTVTNNQPLEIRHLFRGSSSQFPFVTVIPNEAWIRPEETINVAVRIAVPNSEQTEPNTVTLYARGNDETSEKSTYVYVQSSDGRTPTDTEKPKIDWSFNDNCAGKLHRDRCARSRWSTEITVSDTGSGLKRVTSVPSGVEPLNEFISGTKQQTIFYYSSTCCYTTVDISAIDLQGNSYTRRIDVTAWDNLSPGEIAAIVLGCLLILLLLICLIALIICCIRRRKSHDLSYSQRYGSRSPANA